MKLAIVSTVINFLLLAFIGLNGVYPGSVVMILALFPLMNVAGLVLAETGHKKVGGFLVGIGSAAFIPIGLIGVFGAVKVYNDQGDLYKETWDDDY